MNIPGNRKQGKCNQLALLQPGRGKVGQVRGSKSFAAQCMLLMFILSSCAFPGIVSTSAQLPATPPTPQATPLPPVRFPQDEGAHRDLTEWWYYTGHMNATTADGKARHYGFELVFFQALRGDLPPVYAAHSAQLADVPWGTSRRWPMRNCRNRGLSG